MGKWCEKGLERFTGSRLTSGLVAVGIPDGLGADECLSLWRLGGAGLEEWGTLERENREQGTEAWPWRWLGGQVRVHFWVVCSAVAAELGPAVGASNDDCHLA